jgi:DNA polymerase-3 subunit alpha
MATFILEDLSGRIDVVAFPDSFKRYFEYLREGNLVWVKGRFMGEGDSRRISLNEVLPLSEAFQKQAKKVIVRLFLPGLEESVIRDLKEILEKHSGGCPVFFELETPHSYRVLAQSIEVQSVSPSDELSRSVERLLGENSVIIEY